MDARDKKIGELEDELKVRERRITELREEIEELRASNQRLIEACEDLTAITDQWCETFDMEMTDDGCWTWKPFWKAHNKLVDDYNALVRNWNKHIATARSQRNIGRPLAASPAQAQHVLRLRTGGLSLREIAEETSLSLATVRTIVGQANRTDRTTRRHLGRITIDKAQAAIWKRQGRSGDALPKRVNATLAQARKSIKDARP